MEKNYNLTDNEIYFIKEVSIICKGNRRCMSKKLGMNERTLYRKIKKYKINIKNIRNTYQTIIT